MAGNNQGDLTKKQVANILNVSPGTVDNLIRRGDLEAYKLSPGQTGPVRIRPESLDTFRGKYRRKSTAQ